MLNTFELACKLECNSFEVLNEEFESYGYGLYYIVVALFIGTFLTTHALLTAVKYLKGKQSTLGQ